MLFRIVNYAMAALFLVAVALQYNDPDPIRWMAIYGAAALACVQLGRHRRDWVPPVVVWFAAVFWFGVMIPDLLQYCEPADLFRSMDETGGSAELAREAGGVVLTAGWMLVLLWRSRRRVSARSRSRA